jgi:hypothetical protein
MRWPAWLVATAEEDRLSFRQRQHIAPFRQPAIAEAIAIYQYTPLTKQTEKPPGGEPSGVSVARSVNSWARAREPGRLQPLANFLQ